MIQIIVVIHLVVALAMVMAILVQRSEGGIGMGSGGGGGGIMTTRGSANLLSRITAGLATIFICTSLTLAFLAGGWNRTGSIADEIALTSGSVTSSEGRTGESGSQDLLNSLDQPVPVE